MFTHEEVKSTLPPTLRCGWSRAPGLADVKRSRSPVTSRSSPQVCFPLARVVLQHSQAVDTSGERDANKDRHLP